MKKNSFSGRKSIPVDFSKMSIQDLLLFLEIIEELFSKAEIEGNHIIGDTKEITVPIKQLSRVFGVRFASSIEVVKITAAIEEIRGELKALSNLEGIFFSRVKAQFKAANTKSRKHLKVVGGVYRGAWEN